FPRERSLPQTGRRQVPLPFLHAGGDVGKDAALEESLRRDIPLTGLADRLLSARDKVGALLNPKNVVIVGASDRPGNWAQRVWRNLKRYGYEGPIYPFNPGRDAVWDSRCYRTFADLPEPPDHLVVLIPASAVPGALLDAAKTGARSATVMTSGFGEDPNAT